LCGYTLRNLVYEWNPDGAGVEEQFHCLAQNQAVLAERRCAECVQRGKGDENNLALIGQILRGRSPSRVPFQ